MRDPRTIFADEEGVSPVIGVILMVAITVILSAAILLLIGGAADTTEPAGNYRVEQVESNGELELRFESVQNAGNLTIYIDDVPVTSITPSAGDVVRITDISEDSTVRIVQEGTDGSYSVYTSTVESQVGDGGSPTLVTDTDGGDATGAWSQVTYASSSNYVTKIDENGDEVWRFYHDEYPDDGPANQSECYDGAYFYGCMFVDIDMHSGGDVYTVTQEPGEFYRIDSETGDKVWVNDFGSDTTLLTVEKTSSGLYVGGAGSSAYVAEIDPSTGAVGTIWGVESGFTQDLNEAPDGDLYVSIRDDNYNGTAYRFDPASESIVWEYNRNVTSNSGMYAMAPSENGDYVYAVSRYQLAKLDADTGAEVWAVETDDGMNRDVRVINGTVYVATDNGVVAAYTTDGVEKTDGFPYSAGDDYQCVDGSDNGIVAAGYSDTFQQFNDSGEQQWTFDGNGTDFSGCEAVTP